MNSLEKRTAFSLSAVFAVRMLGLFMLLPVLPLHSETLAGATPFLIGMAIGVYGLTQSVMQIPLGLLSDRVGRKPVIIGGLALFAFGSIIAALSDHILMIIAARVLQGAGAIAAATMALAADLTREDHRAKVMAFIGMSIGLAFATAMVIGPVIDHVGGLSGIFWTTAALALLGMALVAFAVPTPPRLYHHRDAGIIGDYLFPVLTQSTLLRMNLSVFLLHLLMTANFSVLPLIFRDHLNLPGAEHWKIYLPVLMVSILFSLPMIIIAEKFRKIKPLFVLSVAVLILSQLLLSVSPFIFFPLLTAFLLFFIGFNFLEAVQPSLVAKYSTVETKGTAMGVYSTAQFFGIFVGGTAGGWVLQKYGISGVFLFGAAIALFYLMIAISLPTPKFYKSRLISLRSEYLDSPGDTRQKLLAIPGIKEVAIATEEGLAYLKVDLKQLEETQLDSFQTT